MSDEFEFGTTAFYFLRHGETDATQNELVQGQQDTVLNAKGRQSAEEVGRRLMSAELASIHASPLRRAWQTAAIVSLLTGAPIHRVPGLMERHWGVYQGRRKSMRPPKPDPATVEPMAAFRSRVMTALRAIAGPVPLLVVSHSGVFRVLCAEIGLAAPTSLSITSTQLVRLDPAGRGGRWQITEIY